MDYFKLSSRYFQIDLFLDEIKDKSRLKNAKYELIWDDDYEGCISRYWNIAMSKFNDIHSVVILGYGYNREPLSIDCNDNDDNNRCLWKFIRIFRDLLGHPIESITISDFTLSIRAFRYMMKFICEYTKLKSLTIENIRLFNPSDQDPILFENFSYSGPVTQIKIDVHREIFMSPNEMSPIEMSIISKVVLNKSLVCSLDTLFINSNFEVFNDIHCIKDLTCIFNEKNRE